LLFFSAIANAAVPYLAGRLFDAIIKPEKIFIIVLGTIPLWLFLIILWTIIRFISDIVDWFIGRKTNHLENIIHYDYLTKGFNTLLELPVSFHRERKIGEIADRLHNAAHQIERICGEVLISLTPQFLSIFAALVISFVINSYLASILMLGIIFYVAVLIKIAPPLAVAQRKAHKIAGRAHGDAYDAIFNVQPIKQAVAENYEQKKIFRNFRIKATALWNKVMDTWDKISFSQRLIITLTQLIIFVFSIFLSKKGR
jgi:ABC-type multidrug transport system fused ATPase/permease subunit